MESLFVSIQAVGPIVLMAMLGTFLKRKGFFNEVTLKSINQLCFKVFLPLLLFSNIYQADISQDMNLRMMGFAVACTLTCFFVLAFVVPKVVKQVNRQGVMMQALFRSNFVILGIPMTRAVFGAESTATVTMLVAVVVPLFNILSVFALELHNLKWDTIRETLVKILKNPLIIASFTAFVFLVLGIRIPTVGMNTIKDLAGIATPLSIVVLGASIEISQMGKNKQFILWGTMFKLVLIPLVEISLAILLGFRGVELMALLTSCATPTAISSFVMAEQMGGDGELAGQLVFVTSITSAFTVFLWIFALHQLALL